MVWTIVRKENQKGFLASSVKQHNVLLRQSTSDHFIGLTLQVSRNFIQIQTLWFKTIYNQPLQNFGSRQPYFVRKSGFSSGLVHWEPSHVYERLWEPQCIDNESPIRPWKAFPIAVLEFHISSWDCYDSRCSFCCFPSLNSRSWHLHSHGLVFSSSSGFNTHQAALLSSSNWAARKAPMGQQKTWAICVNLVPGAYKPFTRTFSSDGYLRLADVKPTGNTLNTFIFSALLVTPQFPLILPPSQLLNFHTSIFIFAFSDLCLLQIPWINFCYAYQWHFVW